MKAKIYVCECGIIIEESQVVEGNIIQLKAKAIAFAIENGYTPKSSSQWQVEGDNIYKECEYPNITLVIQEQ